MQNLPAPRVFTAMLLASLLAALFNVGCGSPATKTGPGEVVLFASFDPIFSEPIVREFEKRTGIKVKMQTDAEAAKTIGLVNRLIARKDHPECDVFWNGELGQTLVLKELGVLAPYKSPAAEDIPAQYRDADGHWTGIAARARVILYNTELVKLEDAPRTLQDLTHARFKNNVAIARPLFGTTFTHAAAMCASLGDAAMQQWFNGLRANGVVYAPGNAAARNLVADGEKAVCVTDTDDANGAFLKKRPVAMVFPDQDSHGMLLIPNSIALIKGGPNPENAKKLIDFLVSADVEILLSKSESAQMPVRPNLPAADPRFDLSKVKTMQLNWPEAAKKFEPAKAFLEKSIDAK